MYNDIIYNRREEGNTPQEQWMVVAVTLLQWHPTQIAYHAPGTTIQLECFNSLKPHTQFM